MADRRESLMLLKRPASSAAVAEILLGKLSDRIARQILDPYVAIKVNLRPDFQDSQVQLGVLVGCHFRVEKSDLFKDASLEAA